VWGTWRGGLFTGDFERQEEYSENRVSLSMTALEGEPGRRTALVGTPQGM